MSPFRSLLALAVAAAVGPFAAAQSPDPPSHLTDYVGKADASFAWKLKGKTEADAGTVYELALTSQTWHDIKWEHAIQVFVPKGAKPAATMVLWNQGGSPSANSTVLGVQIAQRVGSPVAFLYGVPAQPLFGGKREDALIAETFVRYLDTKDPTWPLLFPMVKSVVKAMDALQAFAKAEWQADVTGFVVTGASKRGWTSWLTAATGDKRVKAIAPLVIDTLNMPAQMKNQVAAFGKPSDMIRDYTERKLVPIPDTAEAKQLWSMIDPWVYRSRLTVPKLIINGTNDPYWPLDALNTYWDDLPGEKHILYVPNAGHDLRETNRDGVKELLPMRAVNTLAAFCKCQITGKPMPKLTWKNAEDGGESILDVRLGRAPIVVTKWEADAETPDFRKSHWTATERQANIAKLDRYSTGFAPSRKRQAFFVEVGYEIDGLPFTLSTQLRILEAKK